MLTPVPLFFGVPIAYLAGGFYATWTRYDYGIPDMDWNADGWITLGEIFDSLDIATTGPSTVCREYYSMKDGMPIRRQCPNDRDRTHR